MQIAKIKKVIEESESVKTFITDLQIDAVPGQFVMAWIPELNEKPLSPSQVEGDLAITVLLRGPFTKHLFEMKEGDTLGIRGPFGRGFEITGEKILIVGGGVGMAPLAPLAEKAIKEKKDVTVIVGAATKDKLLFVDQLKEAGARVFTITDDGTCGTKGYVADALSNLLRDETFDSCFTCGPEIMMAGVLSQAKKKGIQTQASIERYMKCGMGVCGSCAIDDSGLRVCMEGPVFTNEKLESTEFGKYARDASGKRVYF